MRQNFLLPIAAILILFSGNMIVSAQQPVDKRSRKKQEDVRPVTIPISVRAGDVKVGGQRGEILEAGNFTVRENGEERTILSLRSTSDSPLHFAVLIQEDLVSSVNLELKGIGNFIRRLPKGSRVMVGYMRGGTLQVRQRFTDDLEKAAESLRIVSGSTANAPFNPYVGILDALDRFDNLPVGRRAILVVSDGLDASQGMSSASPGQSLDLQRAILRAQRSSVAIYPIYTATATTDRGSSTLVSYGQGSLDRLAEETGGRAFFSGTSSPVSFSPFLRELGIILNRQFALTYLSTNKRKGFRRIEIKSDNPGIKIEHPSGVIPRN
jgi:VWFA-related protein